MKDIDPATAKSCCVTLYQADWVRLLLGESFHPGGLALTSRLGSLLELDARSLVLDVACGRGASAVHLARTVGCHVIGIDRGAENVAAAALASDRAGCTTLTEFHVGDVEFMPLDDASVDAVICECVLCTFPDKARTMTEFVRVLRPGGRIGLSDLTRSGELPQELEGLFSWIACIADAQPVEEYVNYFTHAGLKSSSVENHDQALNKMVSDTRQKLLAAELLAKLGTFELPFTDLEQAKSLAKEAAEAVRTGLLGCSLVTATK